MQKNTEKIIHETSIQVVKETLVSLGFNPSNPNETQADLLYLRKIRKGSEEMSRLVKKSLIMITVPAFLYIAWEVIKRSIKG